MTNDNASKIIDNILKSYITLSTDDRVALTKAMLALETISHLNNRPCEACEFHKENGCSQWDCVFDKILYGERG